MQIVFLKIVSAVMSFVVALSGAFPFLFAGRDYISPKDDSVRIIDKNIVDGFLIIKDYQSYKELEDIGVDYNEEFFEEKVLAIATIEYQTGDEIYIKSIYKKETVYTIEYYHIDNNLTMTHSPEYMTFIIEANKDTTIVYPDNLSLVNAFRTYI